MSDLDGIVSISISGNVPPVSEPGFGTPLIAAYHTKYSDRVRSYAGLAGMSSDGFSSSDAAYMIASAVFSQNPPPAQVKIGRRAHAFTQVVHLTPVDPSTVPGGPDGLHYGVLIDGTIRQVLTSTPSHDTLAEVCTDLATQINALPGSPITADGTSGTHVVCTAATAGVLHSYAFPVNTTSIVYQPIKIFDATTDAGGTSGLNDDLAQIDQADGDWYFLLTDSNDVAGAHVAAAYMEARGFGEYLTQTADTGNATTGSVLDPTSTTDFLAVLKTAGYTRTWMGYTPGILSTPLAAGMAGSRATATPGSDTWWGKTLAGVSAYTLSPAQKSAILGKNGNTYTTIGGIAITQSGKNASGVWADAVRFLDWLKQTIQVAIFTLLTSNSGKIPYTDAGADLVAAAIRAVLKQAVRAGGLNPGAPAANGFPAIPAPSVFVPPVASIDPTVRATRVLPGVTFGAQGAGAIQGVTIQGAVS